MSKDMSKLYKLRIRMDAQGCIPGWPPRFPALFDSAATSNVRHVLKSIQSMRLKPMLGT